MKNHKCKDSDSVNFVQSSLKYHPLWVSLYNNQIWVNDGNHQIMILVLFEVKFEICLNKAGFKLKLVGWFRVRFWLGLD